MGRVLADMVTYRGRWTPMGDFENPRRHCSYLNGKLETSIREKPEEKLRWRAFLKVASGQ